MEWTPTPPSQAVILIVEDNLNNFILMTRLLAFLGVKKCEWKAGVSFHRECIGVTGSVTVHGVLKLMVVEQPPWWRLQGAVPWIPPAGRCNMWGLARRANPQASGTRMYYGFFTLRCAPPCGGSPHCWYWREPPSIEEKPARPPRESGRGRCGAETWPRRSGS